MCDIEDGRTDTTLSIELRYAQLIMDRICMATALLGPILLLCLCLVGSPAAGAETGVDHIISAAVLLLPAERRESLARPVVVVARDRVPRPGCPARHHPLPQVGPVEGEVGQPAPFDRKVLQPGLDLKKLGF